MNKKMPAHPDEDRIEGYKDIHEVLTGGSKREPKPLEPTKQTVTEYHCPVKGCGYVSRDHDEAVRHVRMPVDEPLPDGLVVRINSPKQEYVFVYSLFDEPGFTHHHTHEHGHIHIDEKFYPAWLGSLDSRHFKELLKCHYYLILSPEEFEEFQAKYQKVKERFHKSFRREKFVRTAPELENLVYDEAQMAEWQQNMGFFKQNEEGIKKQYSPDLFIVLHKQQVVVSGDPLVALLRETDEKYPGKVVTAVQINWAGEI